MGRGPSCGSPATSAWTVCFVLLWLLVVIGLIICHVAIADAVGPIGDLPDNLEEGFDAVLRFDRLRTDATATRTAARAAVTACSPGALPSASTLECVFTSGSASLTTDSSAQLAIINDAFDRSLESIKRVTNDKYLGVDEFQESANQLTIMQDRMDELNGVSQPAACSISQPLYCEIYANARDLINEADDIDAQIDKFKASDEVKDFEDSKEYLNGMHALPYILVLSMLFFTCWWYQDARLCSSCSGILAIVFFLLFWVLAFALNTVVVAVGSSIAFFSEEVKVEGVVKDDPSLRDLLDHIEGTYPEFYELVFQPLSDPLELLLRGTIVFEVFLIFILFYGCCVCCCRPYAPPGSVPETKITAVVPVA